MLKKLLNNTLRHKRISREVRCLESPDESVRAAAARALVKHQWSPPDEESAAKLYLALGDFASLSRLGKGVLPYLLSLLERTDSPFKRFRDSRFRERIAWAVTEIAGFEAILTLYTDYGFHGFARDKILDPDFIDFLFQRLPELSLPAQRKVVGFLLDADPRLIISGLKQILSDPLLQKLTREKVFRIFELLQESGDPEALRQITELSDRDPNYAAVAGWTRGRRIGPLESLEGRYGMCPTCKILIPLSSSRTSSFSNSGVGDQYYSCLRCNKRLLDPERKSIKDICEPPGPVSPKPTLSQQQSGLTSNDEDESHQSGPVPSRDQRK